MVPSSLVRALVAAVILLALLAGCSSPQSLAAMPDPGSAPCEKTEPQAATVVLPAGTHHVDTPQGGWTRDGRLVRFPWRGDPGAIMAADVRIEWDPGVVGPERLAFYVMHDEEVLPSGARGPFSGTSPLVVRLDLEEAVALGSALTLSVGLPFDNDLPAAAVLLDQPVAVTVEQRSATSC